MLVVLGAVGLARFAFGMIIPAMADDLGLDYRQQGFLGASYFVGYLTVVAALPWLAPRLGLKRLCTGGLGLVAIGLLGMSLGGDYTALSLSYFVTGIGSGAAFVGAMSLPSQWFHPSHRARAAGLAAAGAGIGILASGLIVPEMPAAFGLQHWQVIWLAFAALALLFALLCAAALRARPGELGLTPYGRADDGDAGTQAQGRGRRRNGAILLHLGTIYFLFAVTALTYTTFIVTTMVDELSIAKQTAGVLWAVIGGLSIFSGALFGSIADRFGLRTGMALALIAQGAAYGLIAAGTGIYGLYVSIFLFGVSAWSMPSIVAAAAGDYLGPENAAAGFAILTLMFAVGQALGPASAGLLAEWTGGFAISYAAAVGLNALAVTLCWFLRPAA